MIAQSDALGAATLRVSGSAFLTPAAPRWMRFIYRSCAGRKMRGQTARSPQYHKRKFRYPAAWRLASVPATRVEGNLNKPLKFCSSSRR